LSQKWLPIAVLPGQPCSALACAGRVGRDNRERAASAALGLTTDTKRNGRRLSTMSRRIKCEKFSHLILSADFSQAATVVCRKLPP
jgi:hypothetical protein